MKLIFDDFPCSLFLYLYSTLFKDLHKSIHSKVKVMGFYAANGQVFFEWLKCRKVEILPEECPDFVKHVPSSL